MNKHTNFLNSIPKAPNYLPAKAIIGGTVGVLILFIIVSVFLQMQLFSLKRHLKKTHTQFLAASDAFQQMAKTYPLLANNSPLLQQVEDQESQLKEKEASFKKLTHTILRRPFSNYMLALSKKVPDGLWLTEISIDEDANHISLTGYALKPVFVSYFLQALLSSQTYADTAFDLFSVKKEKKDGIDYIKFEITNAQLTNQDNSDKPK